MENHVKIQNVYTKRIEFDGPISMLMDGRSRLPAPVRGWVRRARSSHNHLDDERFLNYLSRALPTSVELLAQGYLVSVHAPSPETGKMPLPR